VDRFDADPDPDPTFHFDADPDPDLRQNNAAPHADSTPKFYTSLTVGQNFFTFIHSNTRLQSFSFLINGICVMIEVFLDSIFNFF
jgi:hypothetical protein